MASESVQIEGPPPEPRRRKFQIRFGRKSLIAIVVGCVVLGLWFGIKLRRAHRQRAVVEAIDRRTGLTFYSPSPPITFFYVLYDWQVDSKGDLIPSGADFSAKPGPEWIRKRLGLDFLADVAYVGLPDARDADIELLHDLPGLKYLLLHGTDELTSDGLRRLGSLTQLKRLAVDSPQMTDRELNSLHDLSNLWWLNLSGTAVTDEGIKRLEEALPNCRVTTKPAGQYDFQAINWPSDSDEVRKFLLDE